MHVAALLAATAVAQRWFSAERGNCEHAAQEEFDDGTLKRRCVDADGNEIKPEEADLDNKNALCQPAHGDIQCCTAYYGEYTFQTDDIIDAGKIVCATGLAVRVQSLCPSTEITDLTHTSGDDVRATTVWCGDDNRVQCPDPYTRITVVNDFGNGKISSTACCNSAADNCYNENNHCAVADTEHRCCGPPGEDERAGIFPVTCTQTEPCTGEKKWCPPDTEDTLPPAAIAAIAATPVLIIVAAAGIAL